MATSYRSFNYALRPGKATERKMLVDAFRMLHPFCSVDQYEYVGFGSTSFVDFRLIHKDLGIRKLHSIEKDSSSKARFDFNKPFSCLKVVYGNSGEELPKLPWNGPSIVWLDYEGGFTKTVLVDLATFANKAQVGSVLVVTMNVEQLGAPGSKEDEEAGDDARGDEIKALQEVVGTNQVPQDVGRGNFRGWGKADVYTRIINTQLAFFIQQANELAGVRHKSTYCEQFVYFHYEDNAKMATVGWVLRDRKKASKAVSTLLSTMDFHVPKGAPAFKIEPPVFTHKELLHLETQVPLTKRGIKMAGIPDPDLQQYAKIYKYYPAYVEAEIR